MRAVIQRVSQASVTIEDKVFSRIGAGLLILLGVEDGDTDSDIEWLSGKIVRLRIFDDQAGVMNCSVLEAGGEVMVVSQFTLLASTRKGNRPSYLRSARPEAAVPLYERFLMRLQADLGKGVATGQFGAHMDISLVNDGPVTLILDSRQKE